MTPPASLDRGGFERWLIAGDTHADTRNVLDLIRYAARHRCDRIVQVGDFGFWPRDEQGARFLDRVTGELDRFGLEVWFVDGNHEDHDVLDRHRSDPWVTPRVRWLRRGERFTVGGVRFVAAGGAGSVDAHLRTLGLDWSPGEVFTGADCAAVTGGGPADVVLSHDVPGWAGYPVLGERGFPAHVLDWADRSRELLGRAVELVGARLVVHGHLHVERWRVAGWLGPGGWSAVGVLGLGANVSTSDRQAVMVEVGGGRVRLLTNVRGVPGGGGGDLLGLVDRAQAEEVGRGTAPTW